VILDWRSVDPTKLEPVFRADLESLLVPSAFPWTVLHGHRTGQEQTALYAAHLAGGPKAAPPGRSPHEYGLAIDLVPDASPAPGLQPDWDTRHAAWLWLFEAAHRHPRLKSGKAWNDADHLERYQWREHRHWKDHV